MAPADSNFQCDAHPGTPLVVGLYDEEYSVYLCRRASLLSLTAVRRFASYSVQQMFGAIAEFGGDGVGIRPDDGG